MTCPVCGAATAVVDTFSDVDVIYRKRKCLDCGKFFFTEEIDDADQDRIKKDMNRIKREKYDRKKNKSDV